MSLEKRSLLITIEYFYSKSENLPVDQKYWFNFSIDEFKKVPVRNLKQWIANKNLFKIKKTNNNYGNKKITGYFEKVMGIIENEFNEI